jgi:hypothetical protein
MRSPEEYQTYRAARRSIEQWRDWLGRKAESIGKEAIFHSRHAAATL